MATQADPWAAYAGYEWCRAQGTGNLFHLRGTDAWHAASYLRMRCGRRVRTPVEFPGHGGVEPLVPFTDRRLVCGACLSEARRLAFLEDLT
jgi:hypothetical protein